MRYTSRYHVSSLRPSTSAWCQGLSINDRAYRGRFLTITMQVSTIGFPSEVFIRRWQVRITSSNRRRPIGLLGHVGRRIHVLMKEGSRQCPSNLGSELVVPQDRYRVAITRIPNGSSGQYFLVVKRTTIGTLIRNLRVREGVYFRIFLLCLPDGTGVREAYRLYTRRGGRWDGWLAGRVRSRGGKGAVPSGGKTHVPRSYMWSGILSIRILCNLFTSFLAILTMRGHGWDLIIGLNHICTERTGFCAFVQ